MGLMVFLPQTRSAAAALRDTGEGSAELVGHAATAALMVAHDFDDSTLEDAEFAALGYAGVESVLTAGDPLRLVLAAEVDDSQVTATDDPYGSVTVVGLRWADVQALFSDEEPAASAVAAARDAAAGLSMTEALDLAAVETLDEEHDLLWFAPEELDRLP